mgnify:CR=1 FL=1
MPRGPRVRQCCALRRRPCRRHLAVAVLTILAAGGAGGAGPVDIGSRLELFVDDVLVDRMTGDVARHVHRPEPGEVALVCDEPWEGNTSAYYTILEDQGRFRMYYRGWHHDGPSGQPLHDAVVCYAESRDGRTWHKPRLGIVAFEGSTANNIVWDGVGHHNFVPFKDPSPDCTPEARYKAIGGSKGEGGLFVFQSPNAIHWSLMSDNPVITQGAVVSQNLAFWDTGRGG